MYLDLKTLMSAEIENVMLIPQDPDMQFSPAVVPMLQENMFTYQACRDWEAVLYAEVARISVQDLECGKSGLVVELYTEEPQMLLDFGNLCAGNCTREQARLWLHDPNFHVNGYVWDSPGEGTPTQDCDNPGMEPTM